MRICIFCLPRTGSQYCERLISSVVGESTYMSEYLEDWNQSVYEFDSYDNIILKEYIAKAVPFKLSDNYIERINKVNSTNPEQNIIIRMISLFDYSADTLKDIGYRLANANFKFVSLRRDFKSIAYSYIIAGQSSLDGYNIWYPNAVMDRSVTIDIPLAKAVLDRLYLAHSNWDTIMSRFGVSYETLNYSSLVDDVTTVFGAVPTYTGNKTLTRDSLDYIINKDEVRDFIESYNSGL